MRKALNLKKVAGVVALVSVMSLALASTALAREVAGGEKAYSACTLDASVLKNEPGLCSSRPVGSVATQRHPGSPTSSPGLDPMWIAVAGMIAAAVVAGAGVTIYRHRPHSVA